MLPASSWSPGDYLIGVDLPALSQDRMNFAGYMVKSTDESAALRE
jgi:hypothetical protein